MTWKIDREKCLRCGACVSVCPQLALDLAENGVENDPGRCNLCGICMKICPVRAIGVDK